MPRENVYENLEEAIINAACASELYLHNMSGQGILKELSPDIEKLSVLKTLNVSGNLLTDLPQSLVNVPVTSMSMEDNAFEKLPEVLFAIPIEKLYADKNSIKSIPKKINELKFLQRLSLSSNEITDIPETIGDLHLLDTLNLGDNLLKTVPISLSKLDNLDALYLNDNPLEELPDVFFTQMKKLTYLSLSDTKLKKLPESIGELENLERLYLNIPSLEYISESIVKLTKLKILFLQDVKAEIIPQCIYDMQIDDLIVPRVVKEDIEDEAQDNESLYNPAPIVASIISKIRDFSKEHQGETFYAFALDSGLLCFASEESWAEILVKYQQNDSKRYANQKNINKLKFNTGDWKYQGFALTESLSKEVWPENVPLHQIDREVSYDMYKRYIIEFIKYNQEEIFKDIKRTSDFAIFEGQHEY